MTRLEEIAVRKQELIARSDAARITMVRICYQYQARTILVSKLTSVFKNPLVWAGFGLFALKMPWRRTFKLGGWVWRAWRLLQTVRRFAV